MSIEICVKAIHSVFGKFFLTFSDQTMHAWYTLNGNEVLIKTFGKLAVIPNNPEHDRLCIIPKPYFGEMGLHLYYPMFFIKKIPTRIELLSRLAELPSLDNMFIVFKELEQTEKALELLKQTNHKSLRRLRRKYLEKFKESLLNTSSWRLGEVTPLVMLGMHYGLFKNAFVLLVKEKDGEKYASVVEGFDYYHQKFFQVFFDVFTEEIALYEG